MSTIRRAQYHYESAYQLGNSIDKKKQISESNCYIHWEAMQYFNSLGITNFDFGGVNYFSRSFGGDIIPQYDYIKFNFPSNKLLFLSWNFFQTRKKNNFCQD